MCITIYALSGNTFLHTCVSICMHPLMHGNACLCMQSRICMPMQMHSLCICMNVCMYANVYVYAYSMCVCERCM